MFVFLSHIPPEATDLDVLTFVQPALNKSKYMPFIKYAVIEEIKIIGLYDKDLGINEYHGLLIVTPDSAAEKMIKLLNNQLLLGQQIEVREYRVRSINNDPRVKGLAKKMTLKERRRSSRRRTNLAVIKNSAFRPDN